MGTVYRPQIRPETGGGMTKITLAVVMVVLYLCAAIGTCGHSMKGEGYV